MRETCRQIGIEFDPWQRDLNTLILAKTSDGMLAADTVAISICRQAGKTFDIGALIFADCIVNPKTTSIWTAHRFKVARETFDSLYGLARTPLLAAHIDPDAITTAAGNEVIRFRNGSRIVFAARERGIIRGFSKVRRLVLDEAQILTTSTMADLAPTLNQARDPQTILMGTPPKPTDPGEVFTDMRAEALAGESEGTLYVEFGAERDDDLDDRAAWARANPSYPARTPTKAIVRLRKLLTSDDDFAREALGIWDGYTSTEVINPDMWAKRRDPSSQVDGRVLFAPDIAPDRQRGSIALAGLRRDGLRHLEVAENQRGTAWMVPWLVERVAKWDALGVAIDPGSPAGVLIPDLQKAGIEPILMTQRDVQQACGMFFDYTVDDKFRHLDDPRLNTALSAGRKRPVGDSGAWVWHRKDSSTDITPLVSVTFALWGLESRLPEQKKTLTRVSGRVRSG